MIAEIITFVLSNFPLTFLVIGLLTAAGRVLWLRRPAAESFLSQFLLWATGVTFLYNFVMHVFFAEMAARFIGWANSPFQYEVGYASLGFGVVAILAHRKGWEIRLAAVLGPALFLWGAAAGHIYQMVTAHNFAPGNAGVIFWTDVFVPILGFVLLWLVYRKRGAS